MSLPLVIYRRHICHHPPSDSIHQQCNLPSTYPNTNSTARLFLLFLAPERPHLPLLCDFNQSSSLTYHTSTYRGKLARAPSSRPLVPCLGRVLVVLAVA